jgi:hypothetical protein
MAPRWGALAAAIAVMAAAAVAPPAQAEPPDLSDAAIAALRQVCDRQWVEGICEATGYPEPQYRSDDDPSPGQPLVQRVGVVHEHSGFSDGAPDTQPEDYWRAAREGHNTVDGGDGDSGVIVDFLLSSEHSENEKLPITTSEECIDPNGIPDGIAQLEIEAILPLLRCSHVEAAEHHRKWNETLAQSIEGSDDDFTAMRGFEWTNDYFNHLGVYFSRNVSNAKIDGTYVAMSVVWDWLREPAEQGGGSDALVVFNHPGGQPALTPFDGDLPHNQILASTKGGANWDDLAHVADVDERVVGIEVNGGDDLGWFTKALTNGWHLGPVAAEDEHQLEWSTSRDGKTLVYTRSTSPRDYYFALQRHRTVAIGGDLVEGAPGQRALVPTVSFTADDGVPLGSVIEGGVEHDLHIELAGVPDGAVVALVSDALDAPEVIGTAEGGSIAARRTVTTPAAGEDWWFAVACPPGTADCGTGEAYDVVTAPIWLRAPSDAAPAPDERARDAGPGGLQLPATGGVPPLGPWAGAVLLAVLARRGLARR